MINQTKGKKWYETKESMCNDFLVKNVEIFTILIETLLFNMKYGIERLVWIFYVRKTDFEDCILGTNEAFTSS